MINKSEIVPGLQGFVLHKKRQKVLVHLVQLVFVRILLQTGPESEMDALSSERTWLQHMCCTLVTLDVLIYRKRKERFSGKGGNDRKRGWN
jgi:hypothetical protein